MDVNNQRRGWPIWLALVLASHTAIVSASTYEDRLTGDWNGQRQALADKGVTVQLENTSFYSGMQAGTGDKSFEFTNRSDLLVNADMQKLGLWEGGRLHTHVEYLTNSGGASFGGALLPVSTGAFLPLGKTDEVVATSLYLSQQLGSSSSLLLGKINVIDLLAGDPFFGGWGNHRFMNVAFVAPPTGVLPPVIMGAIVNHRHGPFTLTGMFYDPNDHTDDYSLNGLFRDGGNVSLSLAWRDRVFGRMSNATLAGAYSSKRSTDLSEVLLAEDMRGSDRSGAFNISLQLGHVLVENGLGNGQGLGLYAKGSVADGNPNPIEASFSGGISGHGMLASRPYDSFGAGYFVYNFSSDLRSALKPLQQFQNESGIEVFYSFAVSPWLRLSLDVQAVNPSSTRNDEMLLTAVRANWAF